MNGENDEKVRGELIATCEKLHRARLIAATDGNVSCRLSGELLLITPSGSAKGELREQDLLVVEGDWSPQAATSVLRGRPRGRLRRSWRNPQSSTNPMY